MGSGIDGAQEMQIHRLSAAKVRNAKPGLHADGGGLYLQVTCGKDRVSRSWLFRYSLPEIIISASGKPHRRTRDAGLGPTATVSLSEAREPSRQRARSEARRALAELARKLRHAGARPVAGQGYRSRADHQDTGTDLDGKTRNGEPHTRPGRGDPRLGGGVRLSRHRQPS